jgi:small subunit ribosomal protein S24e
MDIEITQEEENELLNRTEVRFSIVHDGETPARLAVRDSLAAKLGKGSDEVVVHKMDTKFGMNETLGHAKVYESPEDAREIEEEYMLERNKIGVEEGDEETEAEEEESGTEDTEEEPAEETEAEEETEEEDEETEEETEGESEETEEEADEEAEGEEEEEAEA